VAQAGDITLNQTLLRQFSTFSMAAVRVAACISDSASLVECVRYIELCNQQTGQESGLSVFLLKLTMTHLRPSRAALDRDC
jgi:hypothetical protein